jgi:hypothetical protein
MKVMTAKEAKNSFGVFIDTAQQEPVLIIKRKRPVGIFLSIQEIENIPVLKNTLLKYMDREVHNPLLAMLGANKNNRSFFSPSEADKFIKELRNEWNS